jgi:CBS domain-containing protein
MRCDEIMHSPVSVLGAADTAACAARRLRDDNIGFLAVCDLAGRVVGTITDRDLATRVLAEGASPETPLEAIMTREIVSCRPADDVLDAERLMALKRKSRIVCVNDAGRPVGIISVTDLVQHEDGWRIARTLKQIARRTVR